MSSFNTFEIKQSFWKSVKYLWRYCIFAGTVYRLKVENFKYCRWPKFSHSIAKVKYLRTWNFRPKCRLSTFVRWSEVLENRSKYLWRYWIFAGTVYRLKVGNFKSSQRAKFSPCLCNTKKNLLMWNFRPKCLLSTRLRWSKVFENRLNTIGDIRFWLGQFTVWKCEISNIVDGLSFHLAIVKLKYLRPCNFRPKCAVSTRLRLSKVFENRSNTFGDIAFLHGQFIGWKWKISNIVDRLSFHLPLQK